MIKKFILPILLVLMLVNSVWAFSFSDLFTGGTRGTTDTSTDSGRASTEPARTTDTTQTRDAARTTEETRTAGAAPTRTAPTQATPPSAVGPKTVPGMKSEAELKLDKEKAGEVMGLNEYSGSFYDVDIAGLYLGSELKNGKLIYFVDINTDMTFPKVYQFVKDGQNTKAKISALKLIFDNYDQALSTYKLIKEDMKNVHIADKWGFGSYTIDFTSNNCNGKYIIPPGNNMYDEKYPSYIQATFTDCEINMKEGSKDEVNFGGTFISWYDYWGISYTQ